MIVVGAGPGGLSAALRLVELGLRPIVIERGKDVRERKKDLAQINREHTVSSEIDYRFRRRRCRSLLGMGNSIPVARREEMWIKS